MHEPLGPQAASGAEKAAGEKGRPAKKARRTLGRIAVLLVAVLMLAAAAAWWVGGRETGPHYLTAQVTRGNVTRVANATGTVNPVLTIIVGAYVSGTIRQVFCDYNTLVRAGQICAKIDARPYKAVLDQYTGQLARDRGLLSEAETDLARYQQLAEQNSIARQQAEDQAYVVEQDKGTVELDTALVEGATVNLAYTDIVAPVDGVVVSRAVTVGQTVASSFQTPTLFLIATDLTNMQVDTNTSEGDIGGVKLGNLASFTVDAYPQRIFEGRILQVRQSPQTVQNVVTFDAVIGVDNKDFALMPGMTASSRIITANRDNVIRVPNQALRYSPTDIAAPGLAHPAQSQTASKRTGRIWLLRAGKPVAVDVVLGLDDDNFTEITEGAVKSGDLVIVGEERGGTSSKPPLPRL